MSAKLTGELYPRYSGTTSSAFPNYPCIGKQLILCIDTRACVHIAEEMRLCAQQVA